MNNSLFHIETVKNNYLYLMRKQKRVHLSEIILLEGDINYTHIYLQNGGKMVVARTLKSLENVLSCYNFHRIHRGILINGKHLQSYDSVLGEVFLTNNHRAIASRRRKVAFEVMMNHSKTF
jgi:DNA-binding LytR/AlgR family response regulator